MAAVGIPQYRLPKDILNREINIIKGVGVEIKLNTKIGRDLTVEDLWKEGYKAVFIAVGAHEGSKIGAEGEERGYEGFVDGVKFLRDANLEKRLKPKNKVLIVGGGDVAIDCARTCLRAGFKDVNIVYRRSRAEMPARKTEVEEAEEEGVKISFLTAPAKILGNNGNVAGAECIRMELGALDVSGRRRPIPIKGSEFIIEADLIISAVGQQPDLSFLAEGAGVNIRGATIEINDNTCQTSREGIFAGGDCVTGPATVIDALAAGNKAARSIDQYIREGKVTPTEDENTELAVQGINLSGQREMGLVGQKTSEHIAYVPVKERACNFREVEFGFSSEAALNEAKRCLRCYRVMLLAMTA
jgi:formate dehydrogenase beta subunit